jgi:hypothetical protein
MGNSLLRVDTVVLTDLRAKEEDSLIKRVTTSLG